MSHLNPAITLVVALVSLTASACGADKPCSTVEDDARPDTYKTVRVVNSTAGPLWLPGYYCGAPSDGTLSRLHMTIDGGEAIDHASSCTTCATLMGACWGPANPADDCCEGEGICPETVRRAPAGSCGECPTGDTCVLQASGACYNLSDGFDLEAKTEFVLALDDSVVVLEFE
jgi:hypothetical protein